MYELMQAFATVVECTSLNRAAKKLNLSQPALSRKISRLEQELGVELFERTGKRLKLTKTGETVYEYALEFRGLHSRLLETLAAEQSQKRITIGASLTTLQATLPELIRLLIEMEPNADIQTITGKTHEVVRLVESRTVDIGLVASKVENETLHCVPLFEDRLCLILPIQHPLTEHDRIDIRQLDKLPMILFSRGTWYRVLMDELLRRYDVYPEVKMEIDSFEAILRLVSTCRTATLLPRSYLRPNLLEDNELMRTDIPELADVTRTTSLIFTDFPGLNPLAKRIVEKAKAHFAKELWE